MMIAAGVYTMKIPKSERNYPTGEVTGERKIKKATPATRGGSESGRFNRMLIHRLLANGVRVIT